MPSRVVSLMAGPLSRPRIAGCERRAQGGADTTTMAVLLPDLTGLLGLPGLTGLPGSSVVRGDRGTAGRPAGLVALGGVLARAQMPPTKRLAMRTMAGPPIATPPSTNKPSIM